MRVKTDAKRQAIVSTAWAVFRESGFERATMSEVSERLGGSKATLYGYFKSKEELFEAALEQAVRDNAEESFRQLEAEGDLRTRLLRVARTYLRTRLAADMAAVDRAMILAAERSDLGARLRRSAIEPHWRRLAEAFEREMAAGHLRTADPRLAAQHFRGLIEADLLERTLYGDTTITPAEIEQALTAGVDAFLRAYAPGS